MIDLSSKGLQDIGTVVFEQFDRMQCCALRDGKRCSESGRGVVGSAGSVRHKFKLKFGLKLKHKFISFHAFSYPILCRYL
ncbi:MAG: hypothetical protein A3208_02050 [Candidatus Methanoprimaticola hominis]|nr:MAG: hypothetical protein A3208_02050 [Methanomassiliicoccales archaeon Mx-06]